MTDWPTILQTIALFIVIAVAAFFLLGWLFPLLSMGWVTLSALVMATGIMMIIVALSKI